VSDATIHEKLKTCYNLLLKQYVLSGTVRRASASVKQYEYLYSKRIRKG